MVESNAYHPGPEVDSAVDELLTLEHAYMELERFRRRFLPRFWDNDPAAFEEWLRHIGKPFRRCDLVQGGKKVGEVPPLAKQTPLIENEGGQHSLYERLATLQNHVKRLPHAGERMTRAALQDLFPDGQADPDLILEWDQLFKAFGYPGYLPESTEATDDSDETPNEPIAFDHYEEL